MARVTHERGADANNTPRYLGVLLYWVVFFYCTEFVFTFAPIGTNHPFERVSGVTPSSDGAPYRMIGRTRVMFFVE